ncbi:MAG: phosphonate ABC transporter, permease protein PhnE [Pseudorhodoplanes sp.]|uniref:phosphonate ABC transporter, permease protein PhnE n=1 Tax=Pseudorhodoplanes sp. TaxID=1934341 RepID=UPI003D109369
MTRPFANLTEADIAAEKAAFPRAFSASLRDRLAFWFKWGGGTLLTFYCMYRFGFLSGDFLHGMGKFGSVVVGQMFPPTGWAQLPTFLKVMGETIAMAFIGTLLGAVFAFPLGFLASKNMTRSRPLQFGTRRFADLLRSFDYLIWALIFVRAIGLGPLAGIMAIAIVETGTFIKLYSEAIENLDRKQVDGVTAAGGNGLQRIRFGVLPQVLPMMLSNTLYMFEHNVRSASILGIVGAGGIGFLLADRLRAYELQEACLIIILVVLTVYAIDYLSQVLRYYLIGAEERTPPADDAEPR